VIRNILIFEPWNLGDLIIAANFARYISERFGIKISFICKPRWAEWLSSQNFVQVVFAFEAPWTEIRGKYNPFNYSPRQIYELGRFIKQANVDFIWDVRGDVKQRLFLKAITRKRVYSPKYPERINVYERLSFFIKDNARNIESATFEYSQREEAARINVVTVFVDSYWPNRQLPYQKSSELISSLLSSGYFVKLIVPPDKDYEFAEEFLNRFPNSISLLKNSILMIAEEIKKSDLVISTDSGWLHMAYYYRVPRIGLCGFDNHLEWAPPGTKIVLADKCLSKRSRYKIKNMYLVPLESLDTGKVMKEIKSF